MANEVKIQIKRNNEATENPPSTLDYGEPAIFQSTESTSLYSGKRDGTSTKIADSKILADSESAVEYLKTGNVFSDGIGEGVLKDWKITKSDSISTLSQESDTNKIELTPSSINIENGTITSNINDVKTTNKIGKASFTYKSDKDAVVITFED